MASFGEGLKRERDKKKITLDQVAVSTKISARMLRALEEEKFDQLPGGIFNKGFVRAYARYLGLDEEKAVADYLAASNPAQTASPEDRELRAIAEQRDKERQRQARLSQDFPWGWVAAALLLVAFGFSMWGVYSGRKTQNPKAVPDTSVQRVAQEPKLVLSPTPAMTSAQPAGSANVKDASAHTSAVAEEKSPALPVSGPGSAPASLPAPAIKTASPASVRSTSLSASEEDTESDKPASTTVKKDMGTFTVLVTAKDNSWLSIKADDKEVFTGTLIAPGSESLHARNSVEIRAGNLGGLEIDFNGKRLSLQGTQGEAKTLVFHKDGLISPTATKSAE